MLVLSGNSTDELVVNSGRLTPGLRVSFVGFAGPPVGAIVMADDAVTDVVVVADWLVDVKFSLSFRKSGNSKLISVPL